MKKMTSELLANKHLGPYIETIPEHLLAVDPSHLIKGKKKMSLNVYVL